MDAQEHRDGGVGGGDLSQWYGGLPIRLRLLVGALHFVALFVVCLAAFFPLSYFVFTGDQRGDVVASLADAAARSALFSAAYVVLFPLLWRLLLRWVHGDGQQRR
jgi:hypothetical protein